MHSSFFLLSIPECSVKSSPGGLIAWDADLVVAGAAIDGAIILGQEWHLCLGTALGADDRVHFAGRTLAGTSSHTG
jgi:hypothetical protein